MPLDEAMAFQGTSSLCNRRRPAGPWGRWHKGSGGDLATARYLALILFRKTILATSAGRSRTFHAKGIKKSFLRGNPNAVNATSTSCSANTTNGVPATVQRCIDIPTGILNPRQVYTKWWYRGWDRQQPRTVARPCNVWRNCRMNEKYKTRWIFHRIGLIICNIPYTIQLVERLITHHYGCSTPIVFSHRRGLLQVCARQKLIFSLTKL